MHYLSDLPEDTRPPYELDYLDDGGTLIYVWDHTVLTADAHHDTRLEIMHGYGWIERNSSEMSTQLGQGCWRVIPAGTEYRIIRRDIDQSPFLVRATKFGKNSFEPDVYIFPVA